MGKLLNIATHAVGGIKYCTSALTSQAYFGMRKKTFYLFWNIKCEFFCGVWDGVFLAFWLVKYALKVFKNSFCGTRPCG